MLFSNFMRFLQNPPSRQNFLIWFRFMGLFNAALKFFCGIEAAAFWWSWTKPIWLFMGVEEVVGVNFCFDTVTFGVFPSLEHRNIPYHSATLCFLKLNFLQFLLHFLECLLSWGGLKVCFVKCYLSKCQFGYQRSLKRCIISSVF